MVIRYKVVTWDRKSAWVGGRLSLTYQKGKITRADPDSLGIMVLGTRKDAETFKTIVDCHPAHSEALILKVMPIGRAKKNQHNDKNLTRSLYVCEGNEKNHH